MRVLYRNCLLRKEEAVCFVVVKKEQQRTLNTKLDAGREGCDLAREVVISVKERRQSVAN